MNEQRKIHAGLLTLAAGAMLVAVLASSAQAPVPFRPKLPEGPDPHAASQGIIPSPPPPSEKQKRDLLKYNFGRMKKDAQELSKLAQSLQDDLEHSNQNVLSIGIISKAEKIEKLAKKIKSTATDLPPGSLADQGQMVPLEE